MTDGLEPDRRYMRRALELAREGWGQTAPNPMVGAVVVRDGEIVGEGHHAVYGGDHAEVAALRAAGDRARGATVYVTLEPCAHFGKTPPCVDALIAAGVARVVAAVADPTTEAGGGTDRLRAAGIEVEVGVEEAAARELNAPFFNATASDRPWITLKLALSLDGALADARRAPGWLTGSAARREVHRLRAGNDAVAVGLGTVRADNPALTVRGVAAPRVTPLRVVLSRQGRLPLSSQLALTASEFRTVVVSESPDLTHARALMHLGVEVLTASTLLEAFRALRARGVRSILVEGGAAIASALVAQSLADRLIIFQAPVVLGQGAVSAFSGVPTVAAAGAPRFRIVERVAFDDDLMTTYAFPDR